MSDEDVSIGVEPSLELAATCLVADLICGQQAISPAARRRLAVALQLAFQSWCDREITRDTLDRADPDLVA
jgi:hypothetical protein